MIAASLMGEQVTLFVTGGAGFIGANFVLEWMRVSDEPVVNIDKLTYAGNLCSLDAVMGDPRHTFVQADILDRKLIASLLAEHSPRGIVHFAAESHVDRSLSDPLDFVTTNSTGTVSLLHEARQHLNGLNAGQQSEFRFINVSTDEVFGSLRENDLPASEGKSFCPNSPYSASKAAADHFARAWFRSFDLPVITTHCSNNFGPRQFPEKLIPLAILSALRGHRFSLYGDGKNIRDWLYVGDHCAALRRVLERGRPGETYNIGGNCELTNIDVIHKVAATLDELQAGDAGESLRSNVEFVSDRPGHDRRYALDSRKINAEFGWQARHSFDAALRETVQWYLDNRSWVERVESGEYRHWMAAHYSGKAGVK